MTEDINTSSITTSQEEFNTNCDDNNGILHHQTLSDDAIQLVDASQSALSDSLE